MQTPSKYQIDEEIYQGLFSVVYRGRCSSDGSQVVLKAIRGESLTSESIYNLKKEFEITKKFQNSPGIIQAFDIESLESSFAIVVEDFGAKSLGFWLENTSFSLEQTLRIGISVASALGEIHAQNFMHKDINPSNIVHNPDTQEVKIIDFGIASLVTRENPGLEISELLGTLPYISPEQTGRMNRLVDYRTDLYSFGATLYELLCGQPPFQTDDLLEIVHCHIARQPARIDDINPDVPRVVGDIVAKLLSKNAEERYQSAYGAQADLTNCLHQLESGNRILDFPVGQQDFSDRLMIGQKLYGRSKEIERLLLGFEQILEGQTSLFLISGQSGVGKTALINEVQKPMTERKGFFISSKFNQFDRNTPYMAIVNAFNQLARQFMTQDEEHILNWRARLIDALKENGGIITETIPNMGIIMGPQPKVDPLPPEENKNRFNVVFRKFVGALSSPEHPIVLFLDDLQWADIASLDLIEQLISSEEQHALFLIGAYRDNEVDPGHPLALLIEEIQRLKLPIHEAALYPLLEKDVNQLISDTLSLDEEETEQLADLVFKKTNGNPFFVTQLLESFYAEKLLFFNSDRSKWQWKLDEIGDYGFSANVVDLLVTKIGKLSPVCQSTLRQAACIGTEFSGYLLNTLQKEREEEIEKALEEAIVSGLILKRAKIPGSPETTATNRGSTLHFKYKFVHDRVLQAVYSTIPEDTRLKIHSRIGQSLFEKFTLEQEDHLLFQTVVHLNLARSLISTGKEAGQLSKLNLQAGKKAKLAAANQSALEYLEVGMSLLDLESWRSDYNLTLLLFEEAAEAAHLTTDREKVAKYTEAVFKNAVNILDSIKAIEVKILSLLAQDNNAEVLQFGIETLKKLGLKIPSHPNKVDLLTTLMHAKLSLLGKTDEEIIDMPLMTDEKILAAMRILSSMSLSAYMMRQELYAYLVMTQFLLIARHGHTTYSPATYSSYGLILGSVLGDVDGGYRIGRLATQLLNKHYDRAKHCRVKFMANNFFVHWKNHIQESLPGLQEAYKQGIDSGNFHYASLATGLYYNVAFLMGRELNQLFTETHTAFHATKSMKQSFMADFIVAHRQAILNLMVETPSPWVLDGPMAKEEDLFARAETHNNRTSLWTLLGLKIILCALFGEYDKAIPLTERARTLSDGVRGLFAGYRNLFFDGFINLRSCINGKADEPKKVYRLVSKLKKQLKKMAHEAPMNYQHLLKLLEAEECRALGKDTLAADFYSEAIELSAKNGFVNDEAFAAELAADFYLSKDNRIVAKSYAEHARFSYIRWGATAKVKHLERKYSGLVQKPGDNSRITETTGTVPKNTSSVDSLDFHSVIKAAQGISQEIVLEKLLETLVKTIVENAGAEKGFLIMEDGNQLRIEAGCGYDDQNMFSPGSKPLDESSDLSRAAVRLAFRSREPMVIGNAVNDESLRHDPYVKKYRPKSILCMPIVHGGKLTALLYLENNKAFDVFTEERIDVLKVLSSQAAISIRNAKLYHQLVASKELLQEALVRAEESDRIKSEFLARNGHELLTPLNPIINIPEWILENFFRVPGVFCSECHCEFVMEEESDITDRKSCPSCGEINTLETKQVVVSEISNEDIEKQLKIVLTSGINLTKMVQDILSFSKLQSGNATLELEETNIDLLFRDVRNGLLKAAEPRQVKIESSNAFSSPTAKLDRAKTLQVLSILGKNAIQFSPEQGTVFLNSEDRENSVLFSVRDEGVGIEKAHITVIFESFRQLDEGHTRKKGGTGLGLALAKNIVELHGGKIWVESEPGNGSTFFVQLPNKIA